LQAALSVVSAAPFLFDLQLFSSNDDDAISIADISSTRIDCGGENSPTCIGDIVLRITWFLSNAAVGETTLSFSIMTGSIICCNGS
jgi:hypothetical protein